MLIKLSHGHYAFFFRPALSHNKPSDFYSVAVAIIIFCLINFVCVSLKIHTKVKLIVNGDIACVN
jgi:hypothetical protein